MWTVRMGLTAVWSYLLMMRWSHHSFWVRPLPASNLPSTPAFKGPHLSQLQLAHHGHDVSDAAVLSWSSALQCRPAHMNWVLLATSPLALLQGPLARSQSCLRQRTALS